MGEDERDLIAELRALGATGPREAAPGVEEQLLAKFRAHSRRRRLRRWETAAAALMAVAASAVMVFWTWTHVRSQEMAGAAQLTASETANATDDSAAGFYPLQDADVLPPLESSMVVRVQMAGSSLRLLGYPMDENFDAEPVQADLLLGQDGLARGVRLIQE